MAHNVIDVGNDLGRALQIYSAGKSGIRVMNNIFRKNLFQAGNPSIVAITGSAGLAGMSFNGNIYFAAGAGVHTMSVDSNSYSTLAALQGAFPGQESLGRAEDPRWNNPANGDYTLRPDSPALNRGVALPEVLEDFQGQPRPAGAGYDIGADERM